MAVAVRKAPNTGRRYQDAKNIAPAKPVDEPVPAPAGRDARGRTETVAEQIGNRHPRSEIGDLKSEIPLANGGLLVRSTPSGRASSLTAAKTGCTPIAVRDLGRGDHRVRVVREGYAAEERRITITALGPGAVAHRAARRCRAGRAEYRRPVPATPGTTGRFIGALSVDSRPSGAKVFVDGKLQGTTPLAARGARRRRARRAHRARRLSPLVLVGARRRVHGTEPRDGVVGRRTATGTGRSGTRERQEKDIRKQETARRVWRVE